MPTRPTDRPRNRLKSPFTRDGPSSSDTVVKATTVSAQYPAGPQRDAEVRGGTRARRRLGEGWREKGQGDRGQRAGDERADRGCRQRRRTSALARHHVSVDRGRDRPCFPGRVQKDAGGGPP